MTDVPEPQTVLPPSSESPDLVHLMTTLHASRAELVTSDGTATPLPDEVLRVLKTVVDAMAQGLAVTITQHNTQLTVQETADLLGMHRPTLVRLLDHGKIPFQHRGRQRVVMLADVIDYRERVRAKRRATLDEMTRTAVQNGTDSTADRFSETR